MFLPDQMMYPLKENTSSAKSDTSLLVAYQDLYNIDEYKRQRQSEQLKIEKQVFPQCIQAPVKYENKRKSYTKLSKSKNKNKTSFPGEEVSFDRENKMENSVTYVQQWLTKNKRNLSRIPFADLNINNQSNTNIKDFNNSGSLKEIKYKSIDKGTRKRSHLKTTVKNDSLISRKRRSAYSSKQDNKKVKKNENDESGIVIDDEPIVIEESQATVIDKDRNAWLAVLETENQERIKSTSPVIELKDDIDYLKEHTSNNDLTIKVPFYKRSSLIETCKHCKDESFTTNQLKEITIENANYIVIVKTFNSKNISTSTSKKSVPIQTDSSETLRGNEIFMRDSNVNKTKNDAKHEHFIQTLETLQTDSSETLRGNEIFMEDLNVNKTKNDAKHEHFIQTLETQSRDHDKDNDKITNNIVTEKKSLVIEESDSDIDIENSLIQVTADIHRSCDEFDYGILADIENQEEHHARARPAPRGYTPNSTDSSEKENFNPNRKKSKMNEKKKCMKKLH